MQETAPFDINASPTLSEFFQRFFVSDFMPHGHCFFWRPEILWLHVLSDAAIAAAYFSIPIMLVFFALKRKDTPFNWMFLMFGSFILLCGMTHVVAIVTQWVPVYRFEGIVKLATAAVSIATAVMLVPIMPKAIACPSYDAVNRELAQKAEHLSKVNQELEQFSRAAVGREERIIELKRQINALSMELGKSPPYDLSFINSGKIIPK